MALNITYSVWAIGLGYLFYKQPIKPITFTTTLLLSAGVIVTLYYKGEQNECDYFSCRIRQVVLKTSHKAHINHC